METKLIKLLKLCIDKKISFDLSHTDNLCVCKLDIVNQEWLFYERININYGDSLNQLIEKVKNYKK